MSSYDGAGGCTTTVTASDGSYTATVTQNGQAVSQTRYDGNAQTLSGTTMNYDAQGRLWHQVDLRDGATTYTYDAGDELRSFNRSGQTTGYDYDGLGRKTLETEPDGGQVQTQYWLTGEVKSVSGARTYPQSYMSGGFAAKAGIALGQRDPPSLSRRSANVGAAELGAQPSTVAERRYTPEPCSPP